LSIVLISLWIVAGALRPQVAWPGARFEANRARTLVQPGHGLSERRIAARSPKPARGPRVSPRPALAVTGLTMLSPAGDTLEQSCATIRAGLSAMSEHAYYGALPVDPEWEEEEPLRCAPVPTVDPYLDGPERLLELALPPLRALVQRTRLRRRELASTALLLSLPAPDAAVASWGLGSGFSDELCARAGLEGFASIAADQSGHASMFAALREASSLLRAEKVSRCLLLGVDSYLSEDRMEMLDRGYRLKSDRAADGLIPGEAAVAMIVELDDPRRPPELPPFALLAEPALAMEPETLLGEKSSTGRGLGEALRGALASRPPGEAQRWVLCDLNGESYRAFEWGVCVTRLPEQLSDLASLTHPAECVGDVGAATGGVLVACAARAFARGYAPAPRALAFTSSEQGLRAALLVEPPRGTT
jgi:3-oxoacyl-[acyl-carrier-protein] synthase-1